MRRRAQLLTAQEKIATGLACEDVKVRFNSRIPVANVQTRVIGLPPLPEEIDDATEINTRSWLGHEVGHLKYQSQPWPAKLMTDKVLKELAFSLEDCRTDREMGEEYPGIKEDRRAGFDLVRGELPAKNVLQAATFALYEQVKEYFTQDDTVAYWTQRIGDPRAATVIKALLNAIPKQIEHAQRTKSSAEVIEVCHEIKEIWKAFFKDGDDGEGGGDGDPDDKMNDGGAFGKKKGDKKQDKSKSKPKKSKNEESENGDESEDSDESEGGDESGESEGDDGDESEDEEDNDSGSSKSKDSESEDDDESDESEDGESKGDDESDESEDGESKDGESEGDESEDGESKDGESEGDEDEGDESGGAGSEDDESDSGSFGSENDEDDKDESGSSGSNGDDKSQSGEDEKSEAEKEAEAEKKMQDMMDDFKSVSEQEQEDLQSRLCDDTNGEDYDWDGCPEGYRPYTAYDQEIVLDAIDAPASFRSDVKAKLGVMQRRLMMDLMAKRRLWISDREHGEIDDTRLARIPTGDKRVYKRKLRRPSLNIAVQVLLDMSGSMAGAEMYLCGQLGYILGESLALVRVPYEVVGFTTGSRNRNVTGEPRVPGVYYHRTSPLRLIEIKPFSMTSRHEMLGRFYAAAQFSGGGTIEGEAIWWAAKRLAVRPEQRKLLITVCDGGPCGTPAPSSKYEEHVGSVLARIRKHGIETIHVGIKTDAPLRYVPEESFVRYDGLDDLLTGFYSQLGAILRGEKRRSVATVSVS